MYPKLPFCTFQQEYQDAQKYAHHVQPKHHGYRPLIKPQRPHLAPNAGNHLRNSFVLIHILCSFTGLHPKESIHPIIMYPTGVHYIKCVRKAIAFNLLGKFKNPKRRIRIFRGQFPPNVTRSQFGFLLSFLIHGFIPRLHHGPNIRRILPGPKSSCCRCCGQRFDKFMQSWLQDCCG